MRVTCLYALRLGFGLGLGLCACVSSAYVPPDGGGGGGADAAAGCFPNNDGVIARNELAFTPGLQVTYLVQSGTASQPIAVKPGGEMVQGVTVWSFDHPTGNPATLTLAAPAGWYAPNFPEAGYVVTTDLPTGTLGAFRAADDVLYLYGFASPTEDAKTLAIYDHPIALLRFPMALSQTYMDTGIIANGMFGGFPLSSTDTYRVQIDGKGQLVLAQARLDNTLRVRTDLTQQLGGGTMRRRIQYGFYHECFGEVARITSLLDEANPDFTGAAEVRVLTAP
ncbi:MAG TPA: hypothetical protein VKN99_01330 [Polyangia bacterium]|nr:hypothetical protein [Polyangia bacterium]